MADTDITLARDGNGQVIRALRLGVLRVRTVTVVGAAIVPLNPTPLKDAVVLHAFLPAGANMNICDSAGNIIDVVSAGATGRKFIVEAVNEAQSTFYTSGAGVLQVAELG